MSTAASAGLCFAGKTSSNSFSIKGGKNACLGNNVGFLHLVAKLKFLNDSAVGIVKYLIINQPVTVYDIIQKKKVLAYVFADNQSLVSDVITDQLCTVFFFSDY